MKKFQKRPNYRKIYERYLKTAKEPLSYMNWLAKVFCVDSDTK